MISISLTSTSFWRANLMVCIPLIFQSRQAQALYPITLRTRLIRPNRKNFYKTILSGSTLYVAGGGGGFVILDVTDLASPTLTSILNNDYGGVISIAAIGSSVYLCTEFSNFFEVDVSDPAAPAQVEEFDLHGYHSLDVDNSGSTIVLANRDFGLRIFDVSSPTINQVGSVESIGQIQDCQGAGDYAYVAGYHQGLQILNVEDPQNPTRVTTVGLEGNVNGVYVSENRAYTAEVDRVESSGGYLEIIDVSSATEPSILGSLELPGRPFDVIVDGTTAYVAVQTEGIAVVDVSNPTAPALISLLDTAGSCYGLALRGNLLSVADGTRGSLLVDSRDQEQMKNISSGFDSGIIQNVAMWDTFLFSPAGTNGLNINDISMPSSPETTAILSPELLGYEQLGSKAATTFNSYLLTIETTAAAGQVRLFDIANPTQPLVLDNDLTVFGDPIKITYCPEQKLAYGSSQIAGLFIYSLDTPEPAGLDIDGNWSGAGENTSAPLALSSSGVAMEINQIRSSLVGTISIIGKRRVQNGTCVAVIGPDGDISGTATFDSGTATMVMSYDSISDTLNATLSGAVTLSDMSLTRVGLRGQLPMIDTASYLSDRIAEALITAGNPVERMLLGLADQPSRMHWQPKHSAPCWPGQARPSSILNFLGQPVLSQEQTPFSTRQRCGIPASPILFTRVCTPISVPTSKILCRKLQEMPIASFPGDRDWATTAGMYLHCEHSAGLPKNTKRLSLSIIC